MEVAGPGLPHMLSLTEEVDFGMLETLLGVAPREDCWPPPPRLRASVVVCVMDSNNRSALVIDQVSCRAP